MRPRAEQTAWPCPGAFQRALDAGEQFLAADRLLDEIRGARLHRLDRHRHVALAGDHDRRQPVPSLLSRSSSSSPPMPGIRASTSRHPSRPGDRPRGMPRRWHRSRPAGRLAGAGRASPRARRCRRRPRRRSAVALRRQGRLSGARFHRRRRLGEAAPDQVDQLLAFTGLLRCR